MGLQVEERCPNSTKKKLWVDCSGSEMSLLILEFQKLLTMHFLFTQERYFSQIFDGVEEFIVVVIVFLSYDKNKVDIDIITVILA